MVLLAPAVLLRPAGLALALWHAFILRLTAPNKARGQRVSLPGAACVVAHTTILPRHGLFNVTHRKKNVEVGSNVLPIAPDFVRFVPSLLDAALRP